MNDFMRAKCQKSKCSSHMGHEMFEMCLHAIMCLKRHSRTDFAFESQRTDLPINTKPLFNQYEMPLEGDC